MITICDIIEKRCCLITLDICLYISEQKLKNFIGIDILNQFSAPLLLLKELILPADNLIVLSCRIGSKGNMNQVEFKNLLGRVGRIEYNLYGNVFIIRDSNMAEKNS